MDEEFQITCNATNDRDAPDMTFTWILPDGVDHYVATREDNHYMASSTLYISRLARNDRVIYKCLVTNNQLQNGSVATSTMVIPEGLW